LLDAIVYQKTTRKVSFKSAKLASSRKRPFSDKADLFFQIGFFPVRYLEQQGTLRSQKRTFQTTLITVRALCLVASWLKTACQAACGVKV